MLKLILFVLPLGLDTFAVSAALGLPSLIYVPSLQFIPVLTTTTQTTVKGCTALLTKTADTNFPGNIP